MRVVVCHNCGGFGVTTGPIKTDDPRERETVVYPCLACNGAGYLHVTPPIVGG